MKSESEERGHWRGSDLVKTKLAVAGFEDEGRGP